MSEANPVSRTLLKRKVGIKPKRAGKPRRVAARCLIGRCTRPPKVAEMCRTHATQAADALFSARVRARGQCELAPLVKVSFPCNGSLQCCHLVPRGYRATRWMLLNALAGCGAHHRWMDLHPLEKDALCIAYLGDETWAELRAIALREPVFSIEETIAALRDGASE